MVLARMKDPLNQVRSYFSVDSIVNSSDNSLHISEDMMNAIEAPSIPPHELQLKVGALVILLRNLDVARGQCNGTRMVVVSLSDYIVECKILTGISKGKLILLPKCYMTCRDSMLPVTLKRYQFPLRLAFAMTINKSQGLTFQRVGLYLSSPVFTHSQLYVAFSRVGRSSDLKVFIEDGSNQGKFQFRNSNRMFTKNIVYSQVLDKAFNDRVCSSDVSFMNVSDTCLDNSNIAADVIEDEDRYYSVNDLAFDDSVLHVDEVLQDDNVEENVFDIYQGTMEATTSRNEPGLPLGRYSRPGGFRTRSSSTSSSTSS